MLSPSSAIPALVCGLASGLPELPRGLELQHCSRAVMGGRGPGGPEASEAAPPRSSLTHRFPTGADVPGAGTCAWTSFGIS